MLKNSIKVEVNIWIPKFLIGHLNWPIISSPSSDTRWYTGALLLKNEAEWTQCALSTLALHNDYSSHLLVFGNAASSQMEVTLSALRLLTGMAKLNWLALLDHKILTNKNSPFGELRYYAVMLLLTAPQHANQKCQQKMLPQCCRTSHLEHYFHEQW